MVQITRYPLDWDGRPLDLLTGVVTDTLGNSGVRAPSVVGPDRAPIDSVGLYLVNADGTPFTGSSLKTKTPYQFGAQGAIIKSNPAAVVVDQATLDSSPDDSDALQAFFDAMWAPEAAQYVWDWSGHWAISKPLYFARPLFNVGDLNVEYHGRRVVCGTLHVLPVARQPGAVPMDFVLTISGPSAYWMGHLYIHAGDRGTADYVDRRFKTGVRFMQTTESDFDKITVVSAKVRPVWFDSQYETWSVRVGTPYEAGSVSKNNIGSRVRSLYHVNCGSNPQYPGKTLSLTPSARVQGGDPGETGVFDPSSGPYAGSHEQRTKLTVPSTTDILEGSYGQTRVELTPANYTSIAGDNTNSMFVFTAGDPIALGLGVGDKFQLVDGSNVGLNDGPYYEISGFGGTSNRNVIVFPPPTTEAAKVYTGLNTEYRLHRVMKVIDGNNFMVFPWIQDSAFNRWQHISGFVMCSGNDGANIQFGYLGAFNSGGGLNASCLYGPTVDNLLVDVGAIGLAHGVTVVTAAIGTSIKHAHLEGCFWNAVQIGNTGGFRLDAGSSFDPTSVIGLTARGGTNSARQLSYSIVNCELSSNGLRWTTLVDSNGVATDITAQKPITNSPWSNKRVLEADGDTTCYLDFDLPSFRMGGHVLAELLWIGNNDLVPTGTLTFIRNPSVANWFMQGASSTTTPGKAILFKILFNYQARYITIYKFPAA